MKIKSYFIALITLIAFNGFSQVELGDKVPGFKSTDQFGNEWELKKNLDQNYLVIYFYPVAFTGGCTKQACSYRDRKSDLSDIGAAIVGISGDNSETLKMFAEENHLNFTLLSDADGNISDIFGVPRSEGGTITREIKGNSFELSRQVTIKRWTFILDKKGKLIYRDSEVNAQEDSNKVTEFLNSL